MLRKKEMICDIASNGTDAVEMVYENRYGTILMDIHMPKISGGKPLFKLENLIKRYR
jgi:CheY-like chemotaxis protein